ncbi:hypothetical protein [Mangrovibacterium lignilyticum]|uniref:hypothetical protein n=1 Tax=Mangrovibacterium lignilyticum TaxID=2668052 RepID=UPI0013D387F9|nr:hypothetical protein [Mangrovibacterium lignilyticum]
MANRKKKKAKQHPPRQQDEQTRMNVYFRNMKEILALCDCAEVVDLLNPSMKKVVYDLRHFPIQLQPEDAPGLCKNHFKIIRQELDRIMHHTTMSLKEGGVEIPAYRFYTYLPVLFDVKSWLQVRKGETEKQICCLLDGHIDIPKTEKQFREKINQNCQTLSLCKSSPPNSLVAVFMELVGEHELSRRRNRLKFTVKHRKQKIRYFKLKQQMRPTFRLGIYTPMQEPAWSKVNRSLFENIPFDLEETLPVYVQSHALERLRERIDIINFDDLFIFMLDSFIDPKVVRCAGYYLVEYQTFLGKMGYWVSRIVDDALVVITFLFLTGNDTPEGERLNKLSGLSKIDMHYWNIDRLSTFYHSDLKDNPTMKQLFCDAGCANLFNLERFDEQLCSKHYQLAEKLVNYLQPANQKDLTAVTG